jgi:two-component system NtrC family response regulator
MRSQMNSRRRRLLVVEDDPGLQRQLKWAFDGFDVDCASTREEAIAAVRRHEPAVILQDLGLPPDPNGVEEGFAAILDIQRAVPGAKIIVVTGREGREHALRAIEMGAYDFCQKPVEAELLLMIVDRAMRIHALEAELERLRKEHAAPALEGIVAGSTAMLKVRRLIEKVAPTQATVLLLGESGTGKERLARALHALSSRAGKPMVAINCAAIPETLLESELFGYERGAFTGAVRQTIGRIEGADGGTLFLDEIGDMPLPLQGKLLRFLQERVIERIGGREQIPIDVRIVAATNRDLESAMKQGAFREDLYYRISEMVIAIPALRERDSDALLIANFFLKQASQRHGRSALRFTREAVQSIEEYPWPGNVRELENRISRSVIMAEGKNVTAADLGFAAPVEQGSAMLTIREVRRRAEAQAVQRALALSGGRVSVAAKMLGITRPTLYDLMDEMAIRRSGEIT